MTAAGEQSASGRGGRAIVFDSAVASYGRHGPLVLDHLHMQVPKSSIYGLLGPSGCGKTTLLKTILGKVRLKGGQVLVFDAPPGDSELVRVPGVDVGYMPQELALYTEFKIKELLYFYGILNGMTGAQIKTRSDFLTDFLQLPEDSRIVSTLSGGQKRRVSFAVALLHQPKLLILDEPTVGVDPVLRAKIWRYLVEIASKGETTILITTHYIEEARQAQRVGLMRGGRLLVQGNPETIIRQHNLNTLEAVFLHLCGNSDNEAAAAIDQAHDKNLDTIGDDPPEYAVADDQQPIINGQLQDAPRERARSSVSKRTFHASQLLVNPWNVLACILKNLINISRHKGFLIFQLVLPIVQVLMFCSAIGRNPRDVPVGVVNLDTHGASFLSQRYLQCLSNFSMQQMPFGSQQAAEAAGQRGQLRGLVHFGKYFTEDLLLRIERQGDVPAAVARGSTISISVDRSILFTSMILQQDFLEAYYQFAESLIAEFAPNGTNPEKFTPPIVFDEPIFGEDIRTFTDYMAPGIIVSLTYSLSIGLTGIGSISERKLGLIDRAAASGVSDGEMMIALLCVSCGITLVQILETFVIIIYIFRIPFLGSLALAFLLAFLQGLTGMSMGILISSLVEEEVEAVQIALGTFYPFLLLSGVIWPLDAMPSGLRYVAYVMPQTLSAAAMRDVFLRGWGLAEGAVWHGVTVNFLYIALFNAAAVLVQRVKR